MIRPKILFEDNHLLVAIKPPGVLSQAGDLDLPDMLALLKADLKERHEKPGNVFLGLVHRLDVNVGGVMVFAKTSKAASRLSEAIRDGQFEKRYLAVVHGTYEAGTEGRLEDRLIKDRKGDKRTSATAEDGKHSSLTYKVLGTLSKPAFSLLDIELETGRFHQIRMQFAARGTPLYNDAKYGQLEEGHDRQIGLWAYRLSFPHPITKEPLVFDALPEGAMFHPFEELILPLIRPTESNG
jgi:23S rRNA pseudouridine1911/1915/1917 synthase